MYDKKNGYVAGAVLFIPFAKKLRDHVEFEKFMCRVLVDNEDTREFKNKTTSLADKTYNFRYNDINAENLTAAGKKNGSKQ